MASIPNILFQNGFIVPVVGLGTWKSKPGEVGEAVKQAIDIGYRHFDCAHVYGNEKELGAALKEKLSNGSVKREELFITSKLWNTYHRPEKVEESCKQTLGDLGLDYLDLYLIHWPMAFQENNGFLPAGSDGKADLLDIDFIDTWKMMQCLVEQGLVRSLGISNFNSKQIQRIIDLDLEHKVQCNQIEISPYFTNDRLIRFCDSNNIAVVAYSPLGSGDRPWIQPNDPRLLEEPMISEIAVKHAVSIGQVILRWGLQRGYAIIPKTVNLNRMRENLQLFNFTLTDEEVQDISSLNINFRISTLGELDSTASPYWPFEEEF